MEIEITLNSEDWEKSQKHLAHKIMGLRYPSSRKGLLLGYALIIAYFIFFLHEHDAIHLGTFFFTTTLFCIYILLYWYFSRKYRKAIIPKEDGIFVGTHKFGFSDSGIDIKSKHTKAFIEWSGIKDISQNEDYIFMFLDINRAHVLPKRDIDNPDSFFDSLCELFNKSKIS